MENESIVLSDLEFQVIRELAGHYYVALGDLEMAQITNGVRFFSDIDAFMIKFKRDKALAIVTDMLNYQVHTNSVDELEPLTLRSWRIAMAEDKAFEAREKLIDLMKSIHRRS